MERVLESQNVFVEKREILDVTFITNESTESMLKIDKVGVIYKLDTEKPTSG